jgi:hypothetical protein
LIKVIDWVRKYTLEGFDLSSVYLKLIRLPVRIPGVIVATVVLVAAMLGIAVSSR